MKRTILIMLSFVLFLSLLSCKKFLEKKSDENLVTPETLNDFQGLLDDLDKMNLNTPSMGEASSDDYFITQATYNTRPVFLQQLYTWSLDHYVFQNDWSLTYSPVYNANLCLDGLEKIQKTAANEKQWNNVKGSALFFRAYSFLNLCWIYAKAYDSTTYNADLGIVLRIESDFNLPSVRSSVKDSYDRVIMDAKESAIYLPNSQQNLFRPSKAAAYALLARAYLTMRQYDSAAKYSDMALQLKNYLLDYNNAGEVDINALIPFKPYNGEIIFYTAMNSSMDLHSTTYALIDTLLYSLYSDEDLRKYTFFSADSRYFKYKGSYLAINDHFFSGIATDELYLIRAESFARAGDKRNAIRDLNTLLEKRYKNGSFIPIAEDYSEDILLKILQERRKELTMRGLRWIDIKRLNKEGGNITPKRFVDDKLILLPPNDDRYALQLPADVILNTGLQQN